MTNSEDVFRKELEARADRMHLSALREKLAALEAENRRLSSAHPEEVTLELVQLRAELSSSRAEVERLGHEVSNLTFACRDLKEDNESAVVAMNTARREAADAESEAVRLKERMRCVELNARAVARAADSEKAEARLWRDRCKSAEKALADLQEPHRLALVLVDKAKRMVCIEPGCGEKSRSYCLRHDYRTSLSPGQPEGEPHAPLSPCCVCSDPICTYEYNECPEKRDDHKNGVELSDGRWVCSEQCEERAGQPEGGKA